MAIRSQNRHPALVHLPIARMTKNVALMSFGQKAIGIAAVGSALTGLIAGEEVNVEGASEDMLITHGNLNVIATFVAGGMALWRLNHRKPSAAYHGIGTVGVGVLAYTAYHGGTLVYDVGVGVKPAKGVCRSDAPALEPGQVGSFVKTAGAHLVHGVQHMAQEVAKGRLIPTLIAGCRKRPKASLPTTAGTPA